MKPLRTEFIELGKAYLRTLAADIPTDVDQPPFDRSLMDGFAVRSADTADAPGTLRLVGSIPAGATADRALQSGETAQINTGAPLPDGADAVVRLEDAERAGEGLIRFQKSVARGRYVTPRASYAHAGDAVLRAGWRLNPLNMAAAAAAGAAEVEVHVLPSAAVFSTGDELVEVDCVPRGSQIRNSNRYLLGALLESEGIRPTFLGTAGDDPEVLRARLESGAGFDVICLTGGVSVGPRDFVPEVLRQMDATMYIEKLSIKPGRPVLVARLPQGTWVFALPGNPVSAFVGFELLVRPALGLLQGRTAVIPAMVLARLDGKMEANGNRRSFTPARLGFSPTGGITAMPLTWRGSGDIINMVGAAALIMRPHHAPSANSGDEVMILPIERPGVGLLQGSAP